MWLSGPLVNALFHNTLNPEVTSSYTIDDKFGRWSKLMLTVSKNTTNFKQLKASKKLVTENTDYHNMKGLLTEVLQYIGVWGVEQRAKYIHRQYHL